MKTGCARGGADAVVGIDIDYEVLKEHDEVEFPEKSHFICVKSEPGVNSLFDHSTSWICSEVFVMEDDIVLNEGVLKLALVI